jgi:hypothetical protein
MQGKNRSWCYVAGLLRNSSCLLLGVLLLTLPAVGQLEIGQLSNQLSGTLASGYNGSYGNLIGSDHSLSVGGTGTLSGFYHDPNFVSYTISPYLNQARDNSSYQSISNASGVNFASSIFSGSNFPGGINFAKAYNSEGNFAIPGVANYTTRGNSQTFGINWAEIVPGLPSLQANFQMGSSDYSIYGASGNGTADNHSISLRSAYTLKGFALSAFFSDGGGHSEVPQILENSSQPETNSSSSYAYGLTASHPLPLHGGFSGTVSSSEFSSNFEGGSNSGTVDTYTATSTFQPTNKFHFGVSTNYSTNLSGSLSEAVLSAGGIAQPVSLGQGTHSLDLTGNASYSILANLQGLAFADRREQYFLGENYASTSYGGGLTYWHFLWGGNFNAAVTLSDNMISTSSANSLGVSSTCNYSRRFSDGWAMGAGFGYAQDVQTLLVTYTTSSYNYTGFVRRRFGKFGWSGGAGGTRTLLTQLPGQSNSSDSFNSSISYSHWLTATASYGKSAGNAIQGALGLIQNPIPQPVLPASDLVAFGGTSYSFSLSSSPVRRLSIGASYAKAITDSNLAGTLSTNDSKMINAIFNYQFRKMYLTGGYSNLVQGFSTSGLPAENVSSFYIGISRWFNFF